MKVPAWRLLTVAQDSFVARLVEGCLLNEGVAVFLDTSNPAPGAFLKPFGDPLAPVKVYVKSYDFDRAGLVLHEVDHVAPDPYHRAPRRIRLLWLATITAVLGVSVLIVLQTFGFSLCALRIVCF